jgi:uncharacterized phage-associated protein
MHLYHSLVMVMNIEFKFNLEKAVEAAATLLKLDCKPMGHLALMKMLYISDRVALDELEQAICGGHYVSMRFGPVLSEAYDLIKYKSVKDLYLWKKYISPRNGHFVKLLADPGNENLCEAEEDILRTVYSTHGHLDRFKVANWTHQFAEWKNPHGSSLPIRVEDILRNLGKSEKEILEIQHEVEREAHFDQLLNV